MGFPEFNGNIWKLIQRVTSNMIRTFTAPPFIRSQQSV